MDQATFDFSTLPAAVRQATAADATAFDIGWDHAQRGLVPPPQWLLPGTPVAQGWAAGRAVFGARTLPSSHAARQWLALRLQAWRDGLGFCTASLTPQVLAQLQATHCPVRRVPLGGPPAGPDALAWLRLDDRGGHAAGHLAAVSRAAAVAAASDVGRDTLSALRHAAVRAAAAAAAASAAAADAPTTARDEPLDAAAWLRLGVLRSFVTPLPFHQAAALPMVVLPPNRVRLLNAAQGLQALVTMLFARPGWAARTRRLAAMLPAHTLRLDFNLFVGAFAPRVLAAGTTVGAAGTASAPDPHPGIDASRPGAALPRALRLALEDAWTHDRVQRRWQHFVLSLGEAGTQTLLDRAAGAGLAGVRTITHAPGQATEGWGLPEVASGTPSDAARSPRLAVRPVPAAQAPHAVPGAAAVRRPPPARRRHDRPAAA